MIKNKSVFFCFLVFITFFELSDGYVFQLIKDDKREEMAELLEGEGGDSLIERLCHPLCVCAKCQLIKGTPNGITNGFEQRVYLFDALACLIHQIVPHCHSKTE